jgi:hypothetical protein
MLTGTVSPGHSPHLLCNSSNSGNGAKKAGALLHRQGPGCSERSPRAQDLRCHPRSGGHCPHRPFAPPPHCLTRSSGAQTSAAGPREDALPSTPAPERGAGSSGGCRAPEGRSPAGGNGDRGRAQGSRWGTGQGRSSRGTRRGSPYAPSHPASALPRGQACLAARCPAPGRAPAEVRGTLRDKVRAGRGAQTVPVGRCRPPRST